MLYPVLLAMGVTDEQIRASWGDRIWQVNSSTKVPAHTVNWIEEASQKGAKYLESEGTSLVDEDPDERIDVPDSDEPDEETSE